MVVCEALKLAADKPTADQIAPVLLSTDHMVYLFGLCHGVPVVRELNLGTEFALGEKKRNIEEEEKTEHA